MASGRNEFEFIRPWRCGECNALMYNVDHEGYPAPGAPVGYTITINEQRVRVCTMCADMYVILCENEYMIAEHNKWLTEHERKNRLGPGKKYID